MKVSISYELERKKERKKERKNQDLAIRKR